MDITRIVSPDDEAAGLVRWEPCLEVRPGEDGPLCSACGWPVDDHPGNPAAFAPPRAA